MSITLNPIQLGKDKRLELIGWACEKFQKSVEARSSQIDGDYTRWMDNYAAKPKQLTRTMPFYKASNFVPQLIRMHTDILAARQIGLIFGTKPFWIPKTFSSKVDAQLMMALGEWMSKKCDNDINFFEPVELAIFLATKTGLAVLKKHLVRRYPYPS